MASWSIRYEKWYDRTLQFFSNTLRPYREIAPDGVYSAVIVSDTELNGTQCLIYSQEDRMTLETADLSMELDSLDTRIPIDGGWLKIDSMGLEPFNVVATDGIYSAQVETDSNLMRFTDCRLTVADGNMTALLTARENRFEYIYLGPAADANADPDGWIRADLNDDGAYVYEIPVSSLDNTIHIATYSAKKKLWYDRELIIDSQTLIQQK
jgi:hypothetical protein